MRTSNYFLLLTICYLSTACKDSTNNNTSSQETAYDSIPAVDSIFFNSLDYEPNIEQYLNANTIKFYSEKLIPIETEGYSDNQINGFLKIDSLRTIQKYEEYLQNLDLGDLRDANAFSIEEWDLSSNISVSIWALKYSSYEACPFYEGLDIYLSAIKNDTLLYTVQIGSQYSVADPPMAFESAIYSRQSDDLLELKLSQKEIEMAGSPELEDDIIDQRNETYTFDLLNGKFIE